MSSRTIDALEARALAKEQRSKASKDGALEAAISSAELYMQALKMSDNPVDRARLNDKCKELLSRAESLKVSSADTRPSRADQIDMRYPVCIRDPTTREKIIILEGSKLNGAVFKPWTKVPDAAEFELREGDELYRETMVLSLSKVQEQCFAGWQRPMQALQRIKLERDGAVLANAPTMGVPGRIDLVQDMASDCSVVASLCAGTARAERGHPRILGSVVHPYDFERMTVKMSPNGKYVLRLYFNGCWRRVDIDDLLPTSNTSRLLHVIDRSHPGLLWPALMEKAYLKVRGGYDFPGSNSGTDLAVLTGWIPQQVFLHDEDVDANSLWKEVFEAFERGNVLLTIGTGKLSRHEQKHLGLAAEHDYAILDMKSYGDVNEMLIKNPWSDGEVWKGAVRRRPNPGHEHDDDMDSTTSPLAARESCFEMIPGTFWMGFNSVFQYFENMYINWNPCLFTHRQDVHFSWHLSDTPPVPNVFVDNPQYSVRCHRQGEIWLLLNRHFRTGDYTHENSGKTGYISLYLYDHKGYKVLSTEQAQTRGPFVDSPNTLLRFEARGNTAYTVVIVSQNLPAGKHNFTLSAFSRAAAVLMESSPRHEHQCSLSSAWTRDTAGGNTDSSLYLQNPQFTIPIVPPDTPVAVVLRLVEDPLHSLDQTNIHVKMILVHSPAPSDRNLTNPRAHRITKFRPRDVVVSSGDYRRGSAVFQKTLGSGTYTLICSTFDQGQLAKFSLDLYTSAPQKPVLVAVPAENAGRFTIGSPPAIFNNNVSRLVAPLTVSRVTLAIFKARARSSSTASTSPLFKLNLEQGQGAYAKVIASSSSDEAEFSSIQGGLRIDEIDLMAYKHTSTTPGLWLVLERPGQSGPESSTAPTQTLEVEILAEERIEIGQWRVMDV